MSFQGTLKDDSKIRSWSSVIRFQECCSVDWKSLQCKLTHFVMSGIFLMIWRCFFSLSHYLYRTGPFTIFSNSWQALSSKVTITHDNLPENVRVVYRPICSHGEKSEKQGVCDQVHVGDEVSVLWTFHSHMSPTCQWTLDDWSGWVVQVLVAPIL